MIVKIPLTFAIYLRNFMVASTLKLESLIALKLGSQKVVRTKINER